MKIERVLFFISSLRRGGAEHHLCDLCRYLHRRSIATAVCTLSRREDGLETTLLAEGVSLFRLPIDSLRDLARPRTHRSLGRIVGKARPDLIHAHLFHAEVVSFCAALFTDIPLVVTRHSAGLEFHGWRRVSARIVARRIETVVAVSRQAAGEAVSMGSPPERVFVVPNAVDTTRFRPPGEHERAEMRRRTLPGLFPGVDPLSCLVVGAVGGLKTVKNFSLFLRMASRIMEGWRDDGRPVRFVILGEGEERDRLERLASRLGLAPYLAMPGHHPHPEAMYALFDVFVLTSVREALPNVVLEAMASGIPCVAADVGDVREVIGDTGVSVAVGDEDGFVAGVQSLLSEEDTRRECGRRARVRALEHYDVEIWGQRIVRLYGESGARRRSR